MDRQSYIRLNQNGMEQKEVSRYLCRDEGIQPGAFTRRATHFLWQTVMIDEMRQKLGKEIEDLSRELTVTLPQAIATAVAMGDLRENSEYKAALERQQLVQARLGQLHLRLAQLNQLANTEAPRDRVGLGSRVVVQDLGGGDRETYTLVLAEMMDIDAGHISLASPLGQALKDRRPGEEVSLRLPTMIRKLRVIEVVTIHEQE
jgi:transcription elongation factor GreA